METNAHHDHDYCLKQSRLVESLAWLSFHVPKCVAGINISPSFDQPYDKDDSSLVGNDGSDSEDDESQSSLSDIEDDKYDHEGLNGQQEVNGLNKHELLSDWKRVKSINYFAQKSVKLDKNLAGKRSISTYVRRDSGSRNISDILHSVLLQPSKRVRRFSQCSTPFNLPPHSHRKSALLFVDISGFTKLSTVMDIEAFSEAINSYFELIVNEVLDRGGDILKFAGDALFVEWRASLSSNEFDHKHSAGENTLEKCTADAAYCGACIVEKFSDYRVKGSSVTLNVSCGLGAGHLVGLHVEDDNYTRREFLFLGDPIDQVAQAEMLASEGELVASKKSIKLLTKFCTVPPAIISSDSPSVIACRSSCSISLKLDYYKNSSMKFSKASELPEYDAFISKYRNMDPVFLERLRRQVSLYVHPVVIEDEFAKCDNEKMVFVNGRTRTVAQKRHRAEAELRSVYVMFIKPEITAKIVGNDLVDALLFKKLDDAMKVVCRELKKFQGQLRQFIVDDKGVVLIATFGLRWSTFPNMVAGRALPATFSIHKSLRNELDVDSRVGATYGKAYCGVVGGVRRHEYSILGPTVNLAARLMCSPQNSGIMIDESVRLAARSKFFFKSLPPVIAKGYSNPVPTFEPLERVASWCEPFDLDGVIGGSIGGSNRTLLKSQKSESLLTISQSKINPSSSFCTLGVIGERCLQRIDLLDITVRNVLQSCAVLGDQFKLSDVVRVQTEIRCLKTFRRAIETAVAEKILVQVFEGESMKNLNGTSRNISLRPCSNLTCFDGTTMSGNLSEEKIFQFSHQIWKISMLKLMLEERKNDLNRNAARPILTKCWSAKM